MDGIGRDGIGIGIGTGLDAAVSPLWNRGEGSRSETGGSISRRNTPLLHYVQLPPYSIGGTELSHCSLT